MDIKTKKHLTETDIVSKFLLPADEYHLIKNVSFPTSDGTTQSFKFQNPLRQNYKHLKTLEHLLGIDMHALFEIPKMSRHFEP